MHQRCILNKKLEREENGGTKYNTPSEYISRKFNMSCIWKTDFKDTRE